MKTIELSKMGLLPISGKKAKETNGGVFWIPAAFVTGLIMSAISNFGDIREGFSDGWNGRKPRH